MASPYLKHFDKDPQAVLDYTFDWTTWLNGDVIAGVPVVTVQTGLMLNSQTNSTTRVTVWLSGGTAGTSYTVACRIMTAAGRTDERTVLVRVLDR